MQDNRLRTRSVDSGVGESGKPTHTLPDVIATPAAVASAWAIAPGELWVVRA